VAVANTENNYFRVPIFGLSGAGLLQLGVAPSGERLRRKGRHGVLADRTV